MNDKPSLLTSWTKAITAFKNRLSSLFSTKKSPPSALIRDDEGLLWNISFQSNSISSGEKQLHAEAGVYPSSTTITYALHVPKLSPHDTLLALQTYLEEHMGEDIVHDASITYLEQRGRSISDRKVTAVLAKNNDLEQWFAQQNSTWVPCRWYFPKQLCLQAFAEQYCPDNIDSYIIDLSSKEITLLHLKQRSLVACRTISCIVNDATTQDIAQTSLVLQITASLLSWNSDCTELPSLILTGKMSQESSWKNSLQTALPNAIYDPETTFESLFFHADCVGAALLAQPSLLGPFPPALLSSTLHPYFQSWKTTLSLFVLLSLLTSVFFYWHGLCKEISLKQIAIEHISHLQKEPWAAALQTLSPDNLQEAQAALEKLQLDMKSQALFPLQPALPSFTQTLNWLADQMNIASNNKETLTIQKVGYAFVQYPALEQRQKPYQLKVEVEFLSPNADVARAFHDLLLSRNDMIDAKIPVKWMVAQGLYKTSFFIKDMTKYSTL